MFPLQRKTVEGTCIFLCSSNISVYSYFSVSDSVLRVNIRFSLQLMTPFQNF